MSCEHGEQENECDLCAAKSAAYDSGYVHGKVERSGEILNYDIANKSLFDENKKLRTLIDRIFDTTPPYFDDGTCTLSEEVATTWAGMTANA